VFKYIFTFLVIAIAWTLAILLREKFPPGITVAIVVTVVALLGLVAVILYRRYKAMKAAKAIEKALNAQAEEQARTVRPEQQQAVRELQAEFTRAVSSLKSTKLGKSGVEALYALPWYVIIGPPGAGKTTALKNSGLQFPYLSARTGGGVKGVGGTRNCEWWLTNEGVLLDTAGRYTTDDDDRDEWFSFLDLLKRHRPQKPLNGLLVAISVEDIANAREEEVDAIARKVRERVDEVQGRLQVVLPVYVLFTKCDLVAGFNEYFGDLRKNERGQIWGYTVPLGSNITNPGDHFAEEFKALANNVDQRMYRRIGAERRVDARERVYQFPQQFASLKDNLAAFVDGLFTANVYQGAPVMRGVYFTSGTQEARYIDKLTSRLRETFGIGGSPGAAPVQPITEQKSFFLRDVFDRVVFPDADVATLSADAIRARNKQRYLMAAGAFATALVLSVIPMYAYLANRALAADAQNAADRIGRHAQRQAAGALNLADLEPVREVVETLRGYESDGAPLYMRFGMYSGHQLYEPMRRLYARAMRQHVVQRVLANDVTDMRRFVVAKGARDLPTSDERRQYHDTLKTHLLLTAPHAPNEPAVTQQAIRDFLADSLTQRWAASLNTQLTDDQRAALRRNALQYVVLLADDAALNVPRDQRIVTDTRTVLNRLSTVNIALDEMIRELTEQGYDLTLQGVIGRAPEFITCVGVQPDHVVRGAFTRRAWEEVVRDRLRSSSDSLFGDEWVRGSSVRNNADQQRLVVAELRSEYFNRYIAEWRRFLSGVRFRDPSGDPTAALGMLQWLTEGGTPVYENLMRTVSDNIHLEDPQDAASSAAAGSAGRDLTQQVLARVQSQGRTGQVLGNAAMAANAARAAEVGPGGRVLLNRQSVAREGMLKGLEDFGAPPPPPTPPAQQGQPAPPPPPQGPTPLREYQEQLAFVRDALTTFLANPTAPSTPLQTALTTAQTRVEALITSAAIESRPVLRNMLPPPINITVDRTLGALAGGSSDRWCSAVVVPFERTLRDRYPFNPAGQDAAIQDVAGFYRPTSGALWAFWSQALQTDVPRVGDQYDFVTRFGTQTSGMYRPELRTFLNRAQDVSTVMFPPEATAPRVDFEIRLRPTPTIAEVTFTSDGQEVTYRNGPEEWHQFHWPAEGRYRGAKIRARGLNGVDETIEQEGEWGLFRLFEAGVVRGSPEARIFSVVWRLHDQQSMEIGVDVRPARSENPFFGVPRRDNSTTGRFLLPFRGEGMNAPHPIAIRGRECNLSGVPNAPRASRRHRSRH
jgi:type VI secretion system protein ImpL